MLLTKKTSLLIFSIYLTPLYNKSEDTYIVDHEVHDSLGHEVSDGLVDDADVGVHEVADGLHLPFQLRVHGNGVPWGYRVFVL